MIFYLALLKLSIKVFGRGDLDALGARDSVQVTILWSELRGGVQFQVEKVCCCSVLQVNIGAILKVG